MSICLCFLSDLDEMRMKWKWNEVNQFETFKLTYTSLFFLHLVFFLYRKSITIDFVVYKRTEPNLKSRKAQFLKTKITCRGHEQECFNYYAQLSKNNKSNNLSRECDDQKLLLSQTIFISQKIFPKHKPKRSMNENIVLFVFCFIISRLRMGNISFIHFVLNLRD